MEEKHLEEYCSPTCDNDWNTESAIVNTNENAMSSLSTTTNEIISTSSQTATNHCCLPLQIHRTFSNSIIQDNLQNVQLNDKKRGKYSFKYSFKGCNNHNQMQNVKFHRIPRPNNKDPPNNNTSKICKIVSYHKKICTTSCL